MIEEQMNFLKEKFSKEMKAIKEIINVSEELEKSKSKEEKKMISSHLESLKKDLKNKQKEVNEELNKISITKNLESSSLQLNNLKELPTKGKKIPEASIEEHFLSNKKPPTPPIKKKDLPPLEKVSLNRVGKKEKKAIKKEEDAPSRYVNLSVRTCYPLSRKLIYSGLFDNLKRALIKANMQFIPENYVSVIIFTTFLSFFVAILLFIFFLFFNVSLLFPFISFVGEPIQNRALKIFMMIFIIPVATFFVLYVYPSLEKKSIENKINQELPFVTIHMSSISGAMKDPSKMFDIIVSTGEYPAMQKEFAKIINEIRLYGYDLVSALRNSSFNCPSRKLGELYNGISTTISSGGDLSQFFEKRAETLLFDYKIEREKYNKSTETFMDIYLSVVIAAPMILMLLLIIMRVSGLGISLSTSMISLVTVMGVTLANIFFLIFLYIKQPSQ